MSNLDACREALDADSFKLGFLAKVGCYAANPAAKGIPAPELLVIASIATSTKWHESKLATVQEGNLM